MAQPGQTPEKEVGWERPNRAWVCGRSLTGAACPAGPDPDGGCPVRAECHPHRRGERWQCTRTAAWGGACRDGPLPDGRCSHPLPPCAPVRSLLSRRGALGRWVVAAVAAVLAAALGSPLWQAVISPGELSSHHRVLVEGCAACHPAAEGGAGWLAAALGQVPTSQNAQCVACHDLGAAGERTHGLPVAELAQRIAQAGPATGRAPALLRLAAIGPAHALAPDGALACATCHREHRGAQAAVTEVSDLRCQTCHVARFQDLARGHPDFLGYPHQRRTRIVFDHSSHRGKHFPRHSAEFRCMGCHEIDAAGEGMGVPAFERACGSCHADDVSAAALRPGQRGIAFHSGKDPAASRFLTLLGAGDPPLAPAQVLSALAERGQRALGERLSAALGRELPAEERAALAGGLPRELLLAEAGPAPAGDQPDRAREDWVERGGWFRQASDASIRYRPRGHADRFLRAWLDLAGELAGGSGPLRDPARELFTSLVRPAAPGRCGYCHSVDELARPDGTSQLRVNWLGRRVRPSQHPPTRFAHRPHFSLQDREGCTTCHRLDPQAEYLAGFAQRDPHAGFASGFQPMSRDLCASCHAGAAGSDACTTCHRYHWGEFAPAFPESSGAEVPQEGAQPAAPAPPAEDSDPDSLL